MREGSNEGEFPLSGELPGGETGSGNWYHGGHVERKAPEFCHHTPLSSNPGLTTS